MLEYVKSQSGSSDKSPKGPSALKGILKACQIIAHPNIDVFLQAPDATLDRITEFTQCNFRTVSVHTQRLVQSGLLEKRYVGREVHHNLTHMDGISWRS